MTGQLVLLRHGETAGDVLTGWEDVPLTEAGRQDALRVGRCLAADGLVPDVVHTSLLGRAINTAYLTLDGCDRLGASIERTWQLNDRHRGGESLLDVHARLRPYWEDRLQPELANGRNVLVVSHGDTIRMLLCHAIGLGLDAAASVDVPAGYPITQERALSLAGSATAPGQRSAPLAPRARRP